MESYAIIIPQNGKKCKGKGGLLWLLKRVCDDTMKKSEVCG